MIICRTSLIILILQIVATVRGQFDKEHCADNEMFCYFEANCFAPGVTGIANMQIDNKECDIHFQIRVYSKNHALIRLKSKEKSILLTDKDDKSKVFFGCDGNGGGNEPIKASNQKVQKNFISKAWKTGISCEFEFFKEGQMFDDDTEVKLHYGTTSTDVDNVIQTKVKAGQTVCDPDWLDLVQDDGKSDSTFLPVDKRFSAVTCPTGSLVFEKDNEFKEATAVTCIKEAGKGGKWRYAIFEKDPAVPVFVADESMKRKVGCKVKGCQTCGASPKCEGKVCPKIQKEGECDIYKCETNIMKIDGAKEATIGNLTCERSGNTAFNWTFRDKTVKNVECATEVHCQNVNPLSLKGCKDCEGLDLENDEMECEKGQIKITKEDSPEVMADSLTCNTKTGEWFAEYKKGKSTVVAKGSTLRCGDAKEIEGKKDEVTSASMSPIMLTGIGIAGLFVIVLICVIVWCCCIKPKKKQQPPKGQKTGDSTSKKTTGSTENSKAQLATAISTPTPPVATVVVAEPAKPPAKVDQVELVEKTMTATTPMSPHYKPASNMMKTALLPNSEEHKMNTEEAMADGPGTIEAARLEKLEEKLEETREKLRKMKQKKREEKSDSKSQSEAASTKKEEKTKKKKVKKDPEEPSNKPREFSLDDKEKKIQKVATVKQTDYPTLAEIDSDWDDYNTEKHEKAKKDAVQLGKEIRAKEEAAAKTVPTAVTPDHPDKTKAVERTQNTRNTVDKDHSKNRSEKEITKLITQLDNTSEQQKADSNMSSAASKEKKK